jgi:hypothetical protein
MLQWEQFCWKWPSFRSSERVISHFATQDQSKQRFRLTSQYGPEPRVICLAAIRLMKGIRRPGKPALNLPTVRTTSAPSNSARHHVDVSTQPVA